MNAKRTLIVASATAAMLAFASPALAVKSGLDGYTGKQGPTCAVCHSGGPTPNVTISGPTTLTAGQTGEYTVRVETSQPGVGMGGAASDGAIVTPGTNTKQKFDEVSHSSVVSPSNGAAVFTFKVQASPYNGTLTVYAVGNAVNDNGNDSGDGVKSAKMDVTVTGGMPPPPPGTSSGGSTGTDAGSSSSSGGGDGFQPSTSPSGSGSSGTPSYGGGTSTPPRTDGGATGTATPTGVGGANGTEFPDGGSVQCDIGGAPGGASTSAQAASFFLSLVVLAIGRRKRPSA